MARELTDKQRLFCIEYIVDCNATQAAIRAATAPKGVAATAPKGVAATASKLLING